jgi:hypothetical protein
MMDVNVDALKTRVREQYHEGLRNVRANERHRAGIQEKVNENRVLLFTPPEPCDEACRATEYSKIQVASDNAPMDVSKPFILN